MRLEPMTRLYFVKILFTQFHCKVFLQHSFIKNLTTAVQSRRNPLNPVFSSSPLEVTNIWTRVTNSVITFLQSFLYRDMMM